MRRGVAGGLAAAALVALAVPAHALAVESLAASGSVTYTWRADPARGCAAAGLCGVQGEFILRPQGDTSAESFDGRIDIPVFDPTATVRVSGSGGDCVDVPGAFSGSDLSVSRRGHGRLVGRIEPPVSSGRCAGPTAQDLGRLGFQVKRSGGKRPSYDLRGRRSFVAGPFTGTVVSTLVLRPSSGGGGFSSSGSFSSGAPPRRKVLLEQVTLRYRVASLPSSLDSTFSGESDPFCAALNTCGASGNLALSFPRFAGTLVLSGSNEVPRPVSSRRAISDLRRGRLFLGGGAPGPLDRGLSSQVSETYVAADGSRCQSTSTSRQAHMFFASAGPTGGRLGLQVALVDPNDAGVLRTYCPGPADTDVFGTKPQVASTSVSVAQLLRHRSVISLSRNGDFAGVGYAGTRGGSVAFSLTLERVRAGTVGAVRP